MKKKALLRIFSMVLFIVLFSGMMIFVPVTAEDGTSLVVNSTVKGEINSGQGIWYDLTVPVDGSISFSLSASKQYFYLNMYLCTEEMYQYNDGNTGSKKFVIWNMAIGADPAVEMSFDHLRAGRYYVLLKASPSDFAGVVDTSAYNLACDFTPAPLDSDIEPNDTVETALAINTFYTGTGHISYEEGYDINTDFYDCYKVTTPSKGTLKIRFEAVPGQYGDIYELKVIKAGTTGDSDWLSLDFTGGAGTVTERQLEKLEPGTYYIKLKGWFKYYSSYKLSVTFDGEPVTAVTNKAAVLVNGTDTSFEAYNINGSNYFKLRDLAYVVNGTQKQFAVGWDGVNKAISLTSNSPYTAAGGEMKLSAGTASKQAIATNSKIYIDGELVSLTAFLIDGNNYFKLRDIAAAFDIGVDWDAAKKAITIDTSKGYTEP